MALRARRNERHITVVATNTLTAGRFKPSDDGDDMRFNLPRRGHNRQGREAAIGASGDLKFRKG